jgi:inorganic pyrophosphatase
MPFPSPFYRWRPHPWHGLELGPDPPRVVHAFIELTPFDLVKYELDKVTGYLRIDRPQRTSSQPPSLYGIIPKTFCGKRVGGLMEKASRGDRDPLDICVFSERPVTHPEIFLNARVIGGLPMIDNDEADDKIIAVLENDNQWDSVTDIDQMPPILVERLGHYFSTYKMVWGQESRVWLGEPYNREHAEKVIDAAIADYREEFGE